MTTSDPAPGHFLAGIAALIRNDAGEYLQLQRSAERDVGAGVWESVTGRVDQGESFEAALHREVREETALRVRIDLIVGLSHFHRGTEIPENELQGVVFACSIEGDDTVTIGPEHSQYRWLPTETAIAFLDAPDADTAWFRNSLERAEALRRLEPPGWDSLHATGVTLD